MGKKEVSENSQLPTSGNWGVMFFVMEHVDVVVVGAGLTGIGAGYHLQTMSPDRSYVILDRKSVV